MSVGMWRNFGAHTPLENAREMVLKSFGHGITYFDLANDYGPPPGSAEENFGRILATDLAGHRDELVVSTKAGYLMWPGPYGEWGSRKYLLASLDQSLERMHLDYVDIFYSHRFDPNTPLEETMGALDAAVRSGKALYVGISSYGPEQTREAAAILRELRVPFSSHQPSYSLLNRWVEHGLLAVLEEEGIGCIALSPHAQRLLTTQHLNATPDSSPVHHYNSTLCAAAYAPAVTSAWCSYRESWRASVAGLRLYAISHRRLWEHLWRSAEWRCRPGTTQ